MTVYFAAADDRVKIGFTRSDMGERMAGLRQYAAGVRLLHSIPGAPRSVERALHEAFSFARAGGPGREWFRRSAVEPHLRDGADAEVILRSLLSTLDPSASVAKNVRALIHSMDGVSVETRRPRKVVGVRLDADLIDEIEHRLDEMGAMSPGERFAKRSHLLRVLLVAGLACSPEQYRAAAAAMSERERQRRY